MAARTFHGVRAASANEAVVLAAATSKVTALKKLLADGADINFRRKDGNAAIHEAASGGLPALRVLIDHRADLNLRGWEDLTPLMIACSAGKSKGSRAALLLIEAGADVRAIRKSDEMTALKFAVKSCEPEVIQALIDHKARINGPRGTTQTPLMLAARANYVPALKVLIENGANPNLKCKLPWAENRTAAGLAEMERRSAALHYLLSVQ